MAKSNPDLSHGSGAGELEVLRLRFKAGPSGILTTTYCEPGTSKTLGALRTAGFPHMKSNVYKLMIQNSLLLSASQVRYLPRLPNFFSQLAQDCESHGVSYFRAGLSWSQKSWKTYKLWSKTKLVLKKVASNRRILSA